MKWSALISNLNVTYISLFSYRMKETQMKNLSFLFWSSVSNQTEQVRSLLYFITRS